MVEVGGGTCAHDTLQRDESGEAVPVEGVAGSQSVGRARKRGDDHLDEPDHGRDDEPRGAGEERAHRLVENGEALAHRDRQVAQQQQRVHFPGVGRTEDERVSKKNGERIPEEKRYAFACVAGAFHLARVSRIERGRYAMIYVRGKCRGHLRTAPRNRINTRDLFTWRRESSRADGSMRVSSVPRTARRWLIAAAQFRSSPDKIARSADHDNNLPSRAVRRDLSNKRLSCADLATAFHRVNRQDALRHTPEIRLFLGRRNGYSSAKLRAYGARHEPQPARVASGTPQPRYN